MCGRFTLTATPEVLIRSYLPFRRAGSGPELQRRAAPERAGCASTSRHQETEAVQLRWGLVPSCADDPKIGYWTINARLDTAPTKICPRRHGRFPGDEPLVFVI
jgi:putative SOS response-associated peptidase YedK